MISTFNIAEHVLAINITEEVNTETVDIIRKLSQEKLEKFNQINFYLEDAEGNGITMPAFFKDLSYHIKHQSAFNKVAIVTDKTIFQGLMELKGIFLKSEVEVFDNRDRLNAINWIIR